MSTKVFLIILLIPLAVQCFKEIPKILLNNGAKIPIVGLGTALSPRKEIVQVVKDAIDIGYRHFDCAYLYRNEKEIGQAIAGKIAEDVVKREDLFIVSKLWTTYHKPESVEPALHITLKDLQLEYIDLYLMHFPCGSNAHTKKPTDDDYVDTWIAMEKLYAKGLARSIGISNFNRKQIERLLEYATVSPVTNQVECHPHLNQRKLIDFCKSRNITITAYGPLGSFNVTSDKPTLLEDSTIKSIAKKFHKSNAQVMIRYQVQRGVIVVPKTVRKERLMENLDVFDFELSAKDMATIDGMNNNGRIGDFRSWIDHKCYPFNDEY